MEAHGHGPGSSVKGEGVEVDFPISFLNDVASYWPYGGIYVCVC